MFGLNWPELLIISVVALIVIGPEDLPHMLRQLGRFTAKLRQMSREFSRAMDQAAKETGVADVAKDIRTATSAKALGLEAAATKFEKWDPLKNAAKPSAPQPVSTTGLVPPPMPATPVAAPIAAKADVTVEDQAAEDLAEMAEDLLFEAEEAAAPTIHGPATQALYDKAALRKQVVEEQTAKLKAIEAGTYIADPATAAPEAAPVAEAPAKLKAPRKAAPKVEKALKVEKAVAEKPAEPKAEKTATKKSAAKATAKSAAKPEAAEAEAKPEAKPKTPRKSTRKSAGEEKA